MSEITAHRRTAWHGRDYIEVTITTPRHQETIQLQAEDALEFGHRLVDLSAAEQERADRG
ncbi:hypothetical protein [Nocardia sp. NPDC004711]